MKLTLNVEIKDYNITITDESFQETMNEIDSLTQGQKRLFIVSKKVYKLYRKELCLRKEEVLVLKDGEQEKNYNTYLKIIKTALQRGITRSDVIIALGGGVVGDLAGFAASTYMRGIDYIQVPTTLLSMVDSSVGGKTSVDMKDTKNIIGTFYQPKAVFININFLKTLDKKQFKSGLGEVLKYALIEENCGYKQALYLLEYLTLGCEKIMTKEPMTLLRVIEYCLNLKISVVNQDEKEHGLRKVLNLGHTLGHALETMGKYRKYTHGEAVVQGIFFILKKAYKQKLISDSYYRVSIELLEKFGFYEKPIKFDPEKLVEIMKRDKKSTKDKITFIIPCDNKKVKEIRFTPKEVLDMLCY